MCWQSWVVWRLMLWILRAFTIVENALYQRERNIVFLLLQRKKSIFWALCFLDNHLPALLTCAWYMVAELHQEDCLQQGITVSQ
jgi:hypothetical protein